MQAQNRFEVKSLFWNTVAVDKKVGMPFSDPILGFPSISIVITLNSAQVYKLGQRWVVTFAPSTSSRHRSSGMESDSQ